MYAKVHLRLNIPISIPKYVESHACYLCDMVITFRWRQTRHDHVAVIHTVHLVHLVLVHAVIEHFVVRVQHHHHLKQKCNKENSKNIYLERCTVGVQLGEINKITVVYCHSLNLFCIHSFLQLNISKPKFMRSRIRCKKNLATGKGRVKYNKSSIFCFS